MSLDIDLVATRPTNVFEGNITHNLNHMADEAGIYKHLWRPEELGITKAQHLIGPLIEGLFDLRRKPDHFKKFNPENGWGDYDGLVKLVTKYLQACELNPDANIEISR